MADFNTAVVNTRKVGSAIESARERISYWSSTVFYLKRVKHDGKAVKPHNAHHLNPWKACPKAISMADFVLLLAYTFSFIDRHPEFAGGADEARFVYH